MDTVALSIAVVNNYGVALTVFASVKMRLVRLAYNASAHVFVAHVIHLAAAQDSLSILAPFQGESSGSIHTHAALSSYVHASYTHIYTQNHKLSLTRELLHRHNRIWTTDFQATRAQGTVSLTSAPSDLRKVRSFVSLFLAVMHMNVRWSSISKKYTPSAKLALT